MKKILSTMIAAALISTSAAVPINAKTWITLSSWAYTDVSNFRKEGLLPESMAEIPNYTININRLQFAEILYETLKHSRLVNGNNDSYGFEDVESVAATCLKNNKIIEGEIVSTDKYGNNSYNFNPDKALTREDMAVFLYRTLENFAPGVLTHEPVIPNDYDDVSDWAKKEVSAVMGASIMTDMGDGNFTPKGELTIEQAITAVYRLYQILPTSPNADGAGVQSSEETFIQKYENGMTETKKGNIFYLKNDEEILMEFESDIYTSIDAVTVNNKSYAVAQHVNKKTDVYDIDSHTIIFSIPYPFLLADNDYIITESSDMGPMTFGLYDYNGKEILEPKYSMSEIDELKANSFIPEQEEYRAPDGWYYYADWHDKGHMYKIDSNGENKQKLSDYDCYNIKYINGWLYYSIRGEDEGKLYCMKSDGTHEQRLTDNTADILTSSKSSVKLSEGYGIMFVTESNQTSVYDDEWVYYIESSDSSLMTGSIFRVKMTDEGAITENISQNTPIDYYVSRSNFRNDGLYFISHSNDDSIPDSVYRYKYGELKKLSGDLNVTAFGFTEDGLLSFYSSKRDENGVLTEMNCYICDENDENPLIWEKAKKYADISVSQSKNSYEKYISEDEDKPDNSNTDLPPTETIVEDMSDDKYTVYFVTKYEYDESNGQYYGSRSSLNFSDYNGNKTEVCGEEWIGGLHRIGDVIYYPGIEYNEGHSNSTINSYDMNTNEKKVIANDIVSLYSGGGEDWFFYRDTSYNLWRYDAKTDTSKQIFPNSNSKKYGELYYVLKDGSYNNGGTYKVDFNGNISLITDDFAVYGVYVPNDSPIGLSGSKYDMDLYYKNSDEVFGSHPNNISTSIID